MGILEKLLQTLWHKNLTFGKIIMFSSLFAIKKAYPCPALTAQ